MAHAGIAPKAIIGRSRKRSEGKIGINSSCLKGVCALIRHESD